SAEGPSLTGLRSQRQGSRPTESLRQPREHHKVGVKLDTLQTPHSERQESVVVFEPAELSFYCATVSVDRPEGVAVARDDWVATGGLVRGACAVPNSQRAFERNHGRAASAGKQFVHGRRVIALVERTGVGLEPSRDQFVG